MGGGISIIAKSFTKYMEPMSGRWILQTERCPLRILGDSVSSDFTE